MRKVKVERGEALSLIESLSRPVAAILKCEIVQLFNFICRLDYESTERSRRMAFYLDSTHFSDHLEDVSAMHITMKRLYLATAHYLNVHASAI